jgi:cell division protein FtsI (penicillin-binding protein 3)
VRVPEETPNAWRATLKSRLTIAAVLFGVWAAVIEVRLVHLQIFRRADLEARAERQRTRTVRSPAKRGEILDRHGHILAYSVDAETIYAVPTEIEDPKTVARELCAVLDECTPTEQQAILERLSKTRAFVYVRRQVSAQQAKRVADLDLTGVGFIKESRRFYPNKELAANLLGYVGIDNIGLGGIEAAYDSQIRGQSGTVLIQTDAKRKAFSRVERPPTSGATIELTIDEYLQHIAERELRAGVAENRASAGTAIIMNPRTGEILALANEPTFNPNTFKTSQDAQRRNRAVQDIYEPGSTFKVVTASAALEEHVIGTEDLIDVSGGRIRLMGARVVHDTHDYGVLSFTDVIVKSSNVGAIKVGMRLGAERLSRYIERFGFGSTLSPDFPSESTGIVWDPEKLNESALASVSMGYQVGVTPLQVAAAVSSVANGGELIEPRVVRALIKDRKRIAVTPKVLRRTITPATAATLTTIMEQVVERGTAKAAQLEGFTVAGKTGTASKLINGHYSSSDYNASFVGFVPSRNPVLTIIVVIDSPHAKGHTGGVVSAPVFKRIAELALRHVGTPRTIDPIPAVMVARHTQSEDGPAAAPVSAPGGVILDNAGEADALPDLRGLSARDAIRTLTRVGMTGRLTGVGFVVDQDPPPGTPIERGGSCVLTLERVPARAAGSGSQP